MKTKFFLSTLFSVFIFVTLSAQVTIGLHGNLGKAWQNYGDDFNQNGDPLKIDAFQINASIYKTIAPGLSFGAEPGYSRRGAACEPGFIGDFVFIVQDASFFANYIQLPLMLRGEMLALGGRLAFSAKLGAGPSYMVSAYRDIIFFDDNTPNERRPVNFKEDKDTNRWDFGAYGGVGIGVPVGPGSILLEGNYYYGILDSSNVLTSLNRSLQIGLGYRIAL